MKAIPIHDAKTNLSKYIEAAKKGESVYIGSFGKAEVVMTAVPKDNQPNKRIFGFARGKFKVTNDAFSPETDNEIAKLMYGEDDDLS